MEVEGGMSERSPGLEEGGWRGEAQSSLHWRGSPADLVHLLAHVAQCLIILCRGRPHSTPTPPPPHPNPVSSENRPQLGGCSVAVLTLGEARRVVVDIGEGDADGGGSREPPQLARHVLGLDHHLVVLLHLPVHAGKGGLDQAWGEKPAGIELCPNFPGAPSRELGFVCCVCGIRALSLGAADASDLCGGRQEGDGGAVIGGIFKRGSSPIRAPQLSAGEGLSRRQQQKGA